jgi:hypothetical protein
MAVRAFKGEETFEPQTRAVSYGYLSYNWSSAYRIRVRLGVWSATRRDNERVLTADSAEELLDKIRLDYLRKRIPRG